jgi:hypothetical protein
LSSKLAPDYLHQAIDDHLPSFDLVIFLRPVAPFASGESGARLHRCEPAHGLNAETGVRRISSDLHAALNDARVRHGPRLPDRFVIEIKDGFAITRNDRRPIPNGRASSCRTPPFAP